MVDIGGSVKSALGFEPRVEPLEETPAGGGDVPPKRGRGRPKGSVNRSTTAAVTKRVRDQIATIVAGVNLVIAHRSPPDVLTDDEMTLLTDALAAEATSSTRILGWLQKTSGVSAHFLLLSAIVTIALPRLQRRGVIPAMGGSTVAANSTGPLETGGAYGHHRSNGFGEDYPGQRADNRADLHAIPSV